MRNEYTFVETGQYKKETTRWLAALKRQENASVIFIPKTDRRIRLAQLMQNKESVHQVLGNPDSYVFVPITFDVEESNELQDISQQVAEYLNTAKIASSAKMFDEWVDYFTRHKIRMILILQEAEIYLNQKGKHVLSLVSQLNERFAPLIRILSFFETDFIHPYYLSFMPASTRLYENIYKYPLYTQEETMKFIHMLEELWDLMVPVKTMDLIYKAGGGHFWLVKQAVREITSYGTWKIESEGMLFRLRTIYNLLLPSEQSLIKKKISGSSEALEEYEKHSLKHLIKMRVVNDSNQCLIGGFSDLILNPQVNTEEIILKDGHIYVNKVPVDKVFSKKELRVIKLLLERVNNIISREDIAKKMWPLNTQEQYSDWAIDQMMARVRKRLKELSLSPKLIEVFRGQGYRLSLPQYAP